MGKLDPEKLWRHVLQANVAPFKEPLSRTGMASIRGSIQTPRLSHGFRAFPLGLGPLSSKSRPIGAGERRSLEATGCSRKPGRNKKPKAFSWASMSVASYASFSKRACKPPHKTLKPMGDTAHDLFFGTLFSGRAFSFVGPMVQSPRCPPTFSSRPKGRRPVLSNRDMGTQNRYVVHLILI